MGTYTLSDTPLPEGEVRQFRIIPENTIVNCTVTEIQERESFFTNDDGTKPMRVEFKFVVADGDYQGIPLWGDTPTTFTSHPDCKLRNWFQEILGTEIDVTGTAINTDDMIGSQVRVVVGNRRWKDKNTGQDREKHFAQDLLRARTAPPAFDDEPF